MQIKFRYILLSIVLIITHTLAHSQVVTSAISGYAFDKAGEPIVAAVVEATHIPSGTYYHTQANKDGYFSINGMRAGGPYKVRFLCMGYKTAVFQPLQLRVAETFALYPIMEEDIQTLGAAVVVSERKPELFESEQTGISTHISQTQMESVPLESRSISEIIRLSAYAGNGMSLAGSDGRMVNFTVDGANFNNNFGLGDQLPGGGNPISLEAIQEIQVVVTPFDIRQSNFVGAGINAITKSGTNSFQSSAYYQYNTKKQSTVGVTAGGPIIENKLFYFVNLEFVANPTDVNQWRPSIDGKANPDAHISRTKVSDMEAVSKFVKQKYGYDTGSYDSFPNLGTNHKLLARIDWNIAKNHKLALRYNYTFNRAWNTVNGNSVDGGELMSKKRSSDAATFFSNSVYAKDSYVNTWSLDFNSHISNKLHNEFLSTFSNFGDKRFTKSQAFPFIDILKRDENRADQSYMSLGYEPFSWDNNLINHVFTAKDDLSLYLGKHKLIIGVSYEHQQLYNSYMRYGTGYYRYSCVEDFLSELSPEIVCLTYAYDDRPDTGSKVHINNLSAYLQDEWTPSRDFYLSYGLRVENIFFADTDLAGSKSIYDITHIDIGRWPAPAVSISPRIGMRWNVLGDERLKIRAGTGLFTGRIPLVLFLNMPAHSGTSQYQAVLNGTGLYNGTKISMSMFEGGLKTDANGKASIDALRSYIIDQGFGPSMYEDDINNLPASFPAVDPKFKMPQTWKTSLAVDYKFPTAFPMSITTEAIFNKTITDVCIKDMSIKSFSEFERFVGVDNRPQYPHDYQYVYTTPAGKEMKVPHSYLLTNTNKGYGYILSASLKATPIPNLNLTLAYTHTAAYEITGLPNDKVHAYIPYVPSYEGFNNERLHPSPHVVPHRILASASYTTTWGASFSAVYEPAYGTKRFSYMIVNDMNEDAINQDLVYIPSSPDQILFMSDSDRDRFWAFVNKDSYLSRHKGEYSQAYALYLPWVHKLDFRFNQNFKLRIGSHTHTLQLNANVTNLLNLLSPKLGIGKKMNPKLNEGRILRFEYTDPDLRPHFSTPTAINDKLETWVDNSTANKYWRISFGIKYLFD